MKLAADLERLTIGIAALRIVRQCIREGNMGKLSAIADRIATTKARLDAEADKLATRLDDIDKAAPVAFQRGHSFIASQQAEVAEIEATLRQLSNLPLESSEDSHSASLAGPKLRNIPNAPPAPESSPAASVDGTGAFVRRANQP